jgi:hypothetical protein
MDQVTKEAIRHLQAYLPQEREAISNDERKLTIRKKDLATLSETLKGLIEKAIADSPALCTELICNEAEETPNDI